MPERTPWWLLLLRMLALAAAILAFAGPVLNPRPAGTGDPLLVLIDGGWGDAPDWSAADGPRGGGAGRGGADRAAGGGGDAWRRRRWPARRCRGGPAAEWRERLAGLAPQAWAPDRAAWADVDRGAATDAFETLWLEDGIGHGGEAELARALLDHGPVTVVGPPRDGAGADAAAARGGRVPGARAAGRTPARRGRWGSWRSGRTRTGSSGCWGRRPASSRPGEDALDLAIDLPVELRNRVARVQLADGRSAAGVVLADDSVRRRKVGLMSGRPGGEAQDLVDPLHYLRKALEPFAEVIEAPLGEMLNAAPDVLILADVGHARRGGAGGAHPLGGEGRASGPLRRAAAGAVGRGAARGRPAAAGAAARRRAVDRRRDVLGRAAAAAAVPGERARSPGCRCRRTWTSRAR